MSESNEYTQELENLIIKTLLPVYEKYCKQQGKDLSSSGVPLELLAVYNLKKKPVAALLRKKHSGCLAFDPEPPQGKN